MRDKLDKLAGEALLLGESPSDAVATVLAKGDYTKHAVDRVCEMYNQKSFIAKHARGEDIEESFPLADRKVVSATLVEKKLPQKKEAQFRGLALYQESYSSYDGTYVGEFTKVAMTKVHEEDPIQILQKVAGKIIKYMEKVANQKQFLQEVCYLYPDSYMLEKLGHDGSTRIPDLHTEDHKEFQVLSLCMEKIAKKKEEEDEDEEKEIPYQKSRQFLHSSLPEFLLNKAVVVTENGEAKSTTPQGMLFPTIESLLDVPTSVMTGHTPTIKSVGTLNPLQYMAGYPQDLIDAVGKEYTNNTEKLINNIHGLATIEDILATDQHLAGTDQKKLMEGYEVFHKMAPTIARTQPLVVKNFLRNFTALGADSLDMQTLIALAKAEAFYRSSINNDYKALMGVKRSWSSD